LGLIPTKNTYKNKIGQAHRPTYALRPYKWFAHAPSLCKEAYHASQTFVFFLPNSLLFILPNNRGQTTCFPPLLLLEKCNAYDAMLAYADDMSSGLINGVVWERRIQ
jgi:hypothetical protein